jgi:hypothetical protein
MGDRKAVTPTTITAVAAEIAGHPVASDRAAIYTAMLESILKRMEALRALPIKDIEPAVVFRPIETLRDD